MIIDMLICALSLGAPLNAADDTTHILSDVATHTHADTTVCTEDCHECAETQKDAAFWARSKTHRIGYEFHTWQNAAGGETPVKFALGYSRVKNTWLHKKPIASIMKFSFDRGIDLNYTMFDTNMSDPTYTGPSGFVGTLPEIPDYEEDGEDEEGGFDLASIGNHYLSVGYALGASLTIRPVAKLRLNGYFHFVPSFALQFSGSSMNIGFMPYLRYGGEISYDWFGVGVEWNSGMSTMSDMMAKLMSEQENASAPKAKFYSNYMRVYIAFKLGKSKKKKN